MRLVQRTNHRYCFMSFLQMAETNTVLFLGGKQGLGFPDSVQLFKDNDNAFHLNNSTA